MTIDQQLQESRIGQAFRRERSVRTFIPNERLILDLVRRTDSISRAEIAQETGLAMQSVVRLVEGLVERGFLEFGARRAPVGRGQPSQPVHLVSRSAFTFGVSIAHDAVSLVLMDLAGNLVAANDSQLNTSDRAGTIGYLKSQLTALAKEARVDRIHLFGAGVATSGYFVRGKLINAPANMDDWALRDLEAELGQALDLPVWLENDGTAAAIGESLFGLGQTYRNFAYIYVATGLGGGLIIDGVVARGVHGNAGEFTGLLPLDMRSQRPTMALLIDMLRADDIAIAGIDDLVARYDPTWPAVVRWLDETQAATNAIVSAIAAIMDPDVIVIGGRVPRLLATQLGARAAFYSAPSRGLERDFPPVVAAEAPIASAALGAASIPLKEHFF